MTLTNNGSRAREIELTSYAELVLAPPAADTAHPAFSKLFVQTEHLGRRRRAGGDAPAPFARRAGGLGGASRGRRGRCGRRARGGDRPRAVPRPRPRRARAGVDRWMDARSRAPSAPCSIRCSRCAAACAFRRGGWCTSPFWTVVARIARGAAGPHRQASGSPTPSTARRRSRGRRRRCSCAISASTPDEAGLFQRLAGHVLYRRSVRCVRRPRRSGAAAAGPAGLWAQGISGDVPIVLRAHRRAWTDIGARAPAAAWPTNTGA